MDFSDLRMPVIDIDCQVEMVFASVMGNMEGDESHETEESRGFYPEKVAQFER